MSDAKDIITNALLGLLLAILSWVIVAEINPDVLYIKKPGGDFADTDPTTLGSCGTFDPVAYIATPGACCTCVGPPPPAVPSPEVIGTPFVFDQNTCHTVCNASGFCNLPELKKCIKAGTPNDDSGKELTNRYGGKCQCIDGKPKEPVAGDDCQTTCAPSNCFVIRPKVGWVPTDDITIYTHQQKRDFAIGDPGDMNHPYSLAEEAWFSMDLDDSIVYNGTASYKIDKNGDGNCDAGVINGYGGLGGNWALFQMVKSPPPPDPAFPVTCKLTLTPNGETCIMKICGTDGAGKSAEYYFYTTTLYGS